MSADLDPGVLVFEELSLKPVFTLAAIRSHVQRLKQESLSALSVWWCEVHSECSNEMVSEWQSTNLHQNTVPLWVLIMLAETHGSDTLVQEQLYVLEYVKCFVAVSACCFRVKHNLVETQCNGGA